MKIQLSSNDYGCGIFDSSYTFPGVSVTSRRNVSCYEIELYYESGGVTHLNGTPYRVKRGAVLCVRPGAVRYSELPLKTYYLKMHASGELAGVLDSLCEYFVSADIEKGISLLLALIKAQDGEDRLLCHSRLLEFLSWVSAESEKAERMSEINDRGSEAVERGVEYIEKNFRKRCTLEDISAHAHLSPVYFHGIFRTAVGKTPYEYLTHIRIEEAKRLILTCGDSMAEISEKCGFSSQSYFNSVFKQKTGETPSAYRRRMLEEYFKTDGIF